MNLIKKIKNVKWTNILTFYIIACTLTYLIVKIPNFINYLSLKFINFDIPANYNKGAGLLIASILSYRIFGLKRKTTFLGNNQIQSIVFSLIFIVAYTILGFQNDRNINSHLWALLFCLFTLLFDILEESAWRGFLNDSLNGIPFWFKGILTGILWSIWHLLIFKDFDQFGGFYMFLLFCVLVSIVMAFAVQKTNSILVSSSIHALLCRINLVTLICVLVWTVIIIFWDKKVVKPKKIT